MHPDSDSIGQPLDPVRARNTVIARLEEDSDVRLQALVAWLDALSADIETGLPTFGCRRTGPSAEPGLDDLGRSTEAYA
jgi:hypothetical protein